MPALDGPKFSPTLTVIDDCESTTNWTCANAGGPNHISPGAQGSSCIQSNGGSTSDFVAMLSRTAAAVDLSAKTGVMFWVNVRNDSGFNTIGHPLYVLFGTGSSNYWLHTIPGGTFLDQRWTPYTIKKPDFVAVGSIADWTAITYIAFSLMTAGSAAASYDYICAYA